ncbi:MAG: growth inhibitor PemK, partial [Caulobacteraceae bacterium]|nr:growth inhibitor PemK [Caulobacteraceae bacterium]
DLGVVKRGEVWLIDLNPVRGHEISKTRPCVIVSPDEMNDRLRTAAVAPMTTGSRPARFRIPIHFQGKDGLIVLDHLRSADKTRLIRKLGALGATELSLTLATLRDMFED